MIRSFLVHMEVDQIELEPLCNDIQVYVSKNHKFNSDTILLSNFVNPSTRHRVIELCCGCGAMSLMWFNQQPPRELFCVDIQKEACDLLKKSLEYNKLDNKITVINDDLKNMKNVFKYKKFNVVACNPPYFPIKSGLNSEIFSNMVSKHQTACSLEDVIKASSQILRISGKLCISYRQEGLCDLLWFMRKYGIEPKRVRFVHHRADLPPKTILVEGRYKSAPGMLVMPPLIMEDGNGNMTDEMKKIYEPFFSSIYFKSRKSEDKPENSENDKNIDKENIKTVNKKDEQELQ